MAYVGVRVEPTVRLGREVEERFGWHGLKFVGTPCVPVCVIVRSAQVKRTEGRVNHSAQEGKSDAQCRSS